LYQGADRGHWRGRPYRQVSHATRTATPGSRNLAGDRAAVRVRAPVHGALLRPGRLPRSSRRVWSWSRPSPTSATGWSCREQGDGPGPLAFRAGLRL